MFALALDVGSSSVRAFVYDTAGRRVGGAKLPYGWNTTPGGGVELEAERLLERVVSAIDQTLAQARQTGTLPLAAGVSALWHTVLGVAGDGSAVTPVYSWSDMRAAGAARELRGELNQAAVHARTGASLHPGYLPARIRWIRGEHPGSGRARWWMSAPEWLELQLFGSARVSVSMASGSGLYDQHRNEWDPEMLAAAGITADRLPPLTDLDEPRRGLAEPWRSRWPELDSIPWLSAIGDGVAANVGSGCLDRTRVALSLGTSGALRVLFREPDPVIPSDLWCYRLDRNRAVIGGAISNGGGVYRWLRRTLRLPDDSDALDAALAELPPDGHGLTILPFWAGERSPHWPLGATATIEGLTTDTTPLQIVQSSLESVAYRLAYLRRRIAERFPEADTIVGSGTALRESEVWGRIIADTFGDPIVVAAEEEASARGVALLALVAAGVLADPADVEVDIAGVIRPDAARQTRYAAGYERHWALDATAVGERDTARDWSSRAHRL
jgi:gluconokinase